MFTYDNALEIATEAHKNQKNRSGGLYVDYLKAVVRDLQEAQEPEDVLIVAILQDIMGESTHYTAEKLNELGVPQNILEIISLLTHRKDQAFIDSYSCDLMASAMPAEEATYEAREKEYLLYIDKLKKNNIAKKVKTTAIRVLLSEDFLPKNQRREKKNKYRIQKYEAALKKLEE